MNVRMWQHPPTQAPTSSQPCRPAGSSTCVGPGEGDMACGEFGPAAHGRAGGDRRGHRRMLVRRTRRLTPATGPWSPAAPPTRPSTRCATSPTARRASQGHAIAEAHLAERGAETTLVSGPTLSLPDPPGSPTVVHVEIRRGDAGGLPWQALCRPRWRSARPPWPTGRSTAAAKPRKLKKDGVPPAVPGAGPEPRYPGEAVGGRQRAAALPWWSALPPRPRTWSNNATRQAGQERAATGSWPTTSPRRVGTFGGADNRVHLIDGGRV